jgi:hypothetical protein
MEFKFQHENCPVYECSSLTKLFIRCEIENAFLLSIEKCLKFSNFIVENRIRQGNSFIHIKNEYLQIKKDYGWKNYDLY